MVDLIGSVNVAVFDLPWSAVHFCSGIAVGLGLRLMRHKARRQRRLLIGVTILIAWEIFEYGFVATGWAEAETMVNIIGDLLIGSVGLVGSLFIQKHRRIGLGA